MAEEVAYPFHSLAFTLIEGTRPRAAFRMKALESGMYELHVERGSAANPTSQFTREVPLETAQGLKDALQSIGVFAWDESYGDAPDALARRWTLTTVFKEGVFSVASKGGSDVPVGFELMLEELYKLDFPRPGSGRVGAGAGSGLGPGAPRQGIGLGTALNSMGSLGLGSIGGMSVGDLGAYGAVGKGGLGDMAGGDLAGMFEEMQRNPQAMQQRMKDEFKHMSPDEQNRLLDTLASTGMASRAWWERFLRGF